MDLQDETDLSMCWCKQFHALRRGDPTLGLSVRGAEVGFLGKCITNGWGPGPVRGPGEVLQEVHTAFSPIYPLNRSRAVAAEQERLSLSVGSIGKLSDQ